MAQGVLALAEQAEALLARALGAAPEHDMVAVLLRSRRSRAKAATACGSFVWADRDASLDEAAGATLAVLTGKGGMWVASGGEAGKVHAYVQLAEDAPPEMLSTLSRRLEVTLGADHKHDAAVVLRLPGTLNHKPRVLGGLEPAPVKLLVDLEGEGWALEALEDILRATRTRPATTASSRPAPGTNHTETSLPSSTSSSAC